LHLVIVNLIGKIKSTMEQRDNTADTQVLTRLKSARKMEREAKDMFGKYLTALNNNTQDDDDVVQLLEAKIQALKQAEAKVGNSTNVMAVILTDSF
jgi:uncharacterized membrane protein YcjF (UPF0283 family)